MTMKINRTVLSVGLGLACASLANAATTNYVYMSGSTAARNAVFQTFTNGSAVFDSAPSFDAQGNSNPEKATYVNFYGFINSTPTTVKCLWSGSEAGIADLALEPGEQFLIDGAGSSSSLPGPSLLTTAQNVDLCMADNDKKFSQNPGANIVGAEVCVIPFELMKEKGSATSLTNVTSAQFRQAIGTVGAKLALFTGNSSDTSYVYVTGRDNNSGTRVNTLGVTAYGIFQPAYQIEIGSNGQLLDPVGDNSFYTDDGVTGYSSGGTVATQLGYDCSVTVDKLKGGNSTGLNVIAYVGISDGNTALANGASQVEFNGVLESPATVKEGQYSLWGNEFIYHLSSPSSQALAVWTKLSSNTGITANSDGSTTIDLNQMHATRGGPTTDPVHK
jgi:hypothetical protein